MQLELECCWCGQRFIAKRRDTKFCSSGCRKAAHDERHKPTDVLPALLVETPNGVTVSELAEAINSLRYITNTFEAGALCSPPRYRRLCRSVADDLQKALRKVGQ